MGKHEIRREVLSNRLVHQRSDERGIKDKKIATALEQTEEFKNASHILFYATTNGEVDTFPIMQKWINTKKIHLPRISKSTRKLHVHEVTSLDQLKTGEFGIKEPQKSAKEINPNDIDLIIVPGIAFDMTGHRIGFGLGYYDRLLKNTNCMKIGLAYEFQIIENIPGEPHDIPVDMIITENKIINTS